MLYALLVLVLGAVTSVAQPCPQVTAHVYGPGDSDCGGGYSSYVMQNFSCIVIDNAFAALKVSRANAQMWADDCFFVDAVQDYCPWTGGVYVPSIWTVGNGTDENTVDYATCLPSSGNPNANLPTLITLICFDRSGNVQNCGPSPVTTSPTPTPTTTTTPIPPPPPPPTPTPSPTNTLTPNPYLISAISLASSAASAANRTVSAYSANPTVAASAAAAESAIESAAVVNQDALNLASDYSASDIVEQLQKADQALINADSLAIIAQEELDVAAAVALSEAMPAIFVAAAAAAVIAANAMSNPAPAAPPSSTTTSATPGPCTLCFGSTVQALTFPTPPADMSVGPGSATLNPTATSAGTKRTASPVKDFNDDARTGSFCSNSFPVPSYVSWSAAGGNTYSPYYNYYASFKCATWSWLFASSANVPFPAAPVSPVQYGLIGTRYAAEHIYEIQEVAFFVDYARDNDATLLANTTGQSANYFCTNGLGQLMTNAEAFVNPAGATPYNLNVAPIRQVYLALEGANGNDAEFVYLESNVNNVKGTFFRKQSPNIETYLPRGVDAVLAVVEWISLVNDYLNDDHVASIYRTVSNRIRQQFYDFGQACNSTDASPDYHRFGNVNWVGQYNAWESQYLAEIQENMASSISTFLAAANEELEKLLVTQTTANFQDRQRYMELRGWIEANGAGLAASINIQQKLLSG